MNLDIGGASLDKYNKPITDEALDQATKSDAVLLACVGTPKYDDNLVNSSRTWIACIKKAFKSFYKYQTYFCL